MGSAQSKRVFNEAKSGGQPAQTQTQQSQTKVLSPGDAKSSIVTISRRDKTTKKTETLQNKKKKKKKKKPLSKFPGFLKALEKDALNVVVCYNTKGVVEYISDNVYDLLGCDSDALVETLDHSIAPHQGAIYFRLHTDGSLVQFHNTFWSKTESGELYTIDQPLLDARIAPVSLLVESKGDIVSCTGWEQFKQVNEGNLLGKNLFDLCSTSQTVAVSDALRGCIAHGKCSFSLRSKWTIEMCSREVLMSFHPCVGGQVVVSVSAMDGSVKESGGGGLTTVKHIKHMRNMRSTKSMHSSASTIVLPDEEHSQTVSVEVDSTSRCSTHHGYGCEAKHTHAHSENQVYYLHRQNQEMNAQMEYLQDFREKALLPMYSIDKDAVILWANEAMLKMMGYSEARDEFIGSIAFQYHIDQALVQHMSQTVINGQLLENFPCQVIRRDGQVITVTYNSNAKFDANGGFSHSRCIVQNITEQKKIKEERDEMERSKQVAEVNEKEALTASRTKSDFLAVMSHEIRTPINGVIGAASLLTTTALSDEQLDYVKTISDSADILLSLIRNILDISKIEKGKFQLDRVPIRIVDLVRKCTEMMKNQAMERGLSVVTTVDDDLDDPDVWHHGDPTRLNQILLNFLSNAVKFTHAGSVTCKLMKVTAEVPSVCVNSGDVKPVLYHSDSGIKSANNGRPRIDILDDDDEGRCSPGVSVRMPSSKVSSSNVDVIRLEVTDTGVGVEDCSKLFSDFVQASSSLHQKYGGSGLGLSISKKLVHMMHGQVRSFGILFVINNSSCCVNHRACMQVYVFCLTLVIFICILYFAASIGGNVFHSRCRNDGVGGDPFPTCSGTTQRSLFHSFQQNCNERASPFLS